MVQDVFDSILQDLGNVLKIPNLHLDRSRTCFLKFKNGVNIYIQPFENKEFMLISTTVGEIPAGRYRESVFREALKENTLSGPKSGVFGFSRHSNQLKLFTLLSLREINGEKIASFLAPYMDKALVWQTTLASGAVPLADTMKTSNTAPMGGAFGLRP